MLPEKTMTSFARRRNALAVLAALPACFLPAIAGASDPDEEFVAIEQDLDGRLGVWAVDTGSGRVLAYREHERFAMCSTFKVLAVAAALARSVDEPDFLRRRIRYSQRDLVMFSPVTERHQADGMRLEQLCAAALTHSDNTAADLILRQVGGPEGLTRYARDIGDSMFRLDRWGLDSHTAYPGDPRDTTTPAAMGATLEALLLGQVLPARERTLLTGWMRDCATGAGRIRAGIPAGWDLAHKTGTGGHGSANDVGMIWPPDRAPIVLAIYTTRHEKDSRPRSDIVAATARLVAGQLASPATAIAGSRAATLASFLPYTFLSNK